MQIAVLLFALLITAAPHTATALWSRFHTVRYNTLFAQAGKPDGGWYVSPIHSLVLPDGNVLVAAWVRDKEFECQNYVEFGATFVVNPATLTQSSGAGTTLSISPIWEEPEVFADEERDTITFSGHTNLPDGKKFFFGGTRLRLNPGNWGAGIDYARIFDPKTSTYTRIPYKAPFGTGWYPTATMLPDQRILVTPGFTVSGVNSAALATFDYQKYKNEKVNPWQVLLTNEESLSEITPGAKDYTRFFVLAKPVVSNGLTRQVAVQGKGSIILLLNTDEYGKRENRFAGKPNYRRPGPGLCGSDTTGALLATGEIMMMGGLDCRKSFIDLYNPETDTWRSFDTGINRALGSSVLLPDGRVLLINGENEETNQETGATTGGDPRIPQIFDPFTGDIENLDTEPADGTDSPRNQAAFRGYHSIASLLFDGRILVGGGRHEDGITGCEHPSLRVFSPPYIQSSDPKPVVNTLSCDAQLELTLDDPSSFIELEFSSADDLFPSSDEPNTRSGAVAMALSGMTHAYDQTQRYVPLRYERAGSYIRVFAPSTPMGIPGDYILYFVTNKGKPSEGLALKFNPSLGKWKRTVLYVYRPTPPNQRVGAPEMQIRGGHSLQVASRFSGRESEPIVHRNLILRGKNDFTLDWQSNTQLFWTCPFGTNNWFNTARVFFTRFSYGVDPENNMGDDYWKLDVYMPVFEDDDPEYSDWFEFKVRLTNLDGSVVQEEPDISHVSSSGPAPPVRTQSHWARKGHVNIFRFGQNEADIYSLNELSAPEKFLPYSLPSSNSDSSVFNVPGGGEDVGESTGSGSSGTRGPSTAFIAVIAGCAALVVSIGAALVVFIRRRTHQNAPASAVSPPDAVEFSTENPAYEC